MLNWNLITPDDVIEAIRIFNEENPEYPSPRSSFLLYEGRKYPAKHIRGMAYKVHFGKDVNKADYSGGEESIKFFQKLGFETQYVHRSVNTHPVKSSKACKKETKIIQADVIASAKDDKFQENECVDKIQGETEKGFLKIGLYLQTDNVCNKKIFEKMMAAVRKSDIDIIVMPEISYVPFVNDMKKSDFLDADDMTILYDRAIELSKFIGKAVVFSNEDKYGTIMSIYANAFAGAEETVCKDYIKHTATSYSAFDINDYQQYAQRIFDPIIFKGHRIGLTICYDCNHAMFSRKYGLNGADIIINSTGGEVIYDKWNKYNKARAIENHCFVFVTMGGPSGDNTHNYVYGFTPDGKEMNPALLNGVYDGRRNISGSIYIYDTSEYDGSVEVDSSIHQSETKNKKTDLFIPARNIKSFIEKGKTVSDHVRILEHNDVNVVMCMIEDDDIMMPEKVLKLLYNKDLKKYPNKRYILINQWESVDLDYYQSKLSLILKVRSMENYCAVILASSNLTKCFQCGQNRTAQVVATENGQFGIDLARTGGPETIWRNKPGMKGSWRKNVDWLVDSL